MEYPFVCIFTSNVLKSKFNRNVRLNFDFKTWEMKTLWITYLPALVYNPTGGSQSPSSRTVLDSAELDPLSLVSCLLCVDESSISSSRSGHHFFRLRSDQMTHFLRKFKVALKFIILRVCKIPFRQQSIVNTTRSFSHLRKETVVSIFHTF